MATCTLTCPAGQRCGFTDFREQKCFADCADPECGGHGSCTQVYGKDFSCVCDSSYALTSGTCTLACYQSCSQNGYKCGINADGVTAKCFDSACQSCSAMSYCVQKNAGAGFSCACPTGFASDTSCNGCATGYQAKDGLCYEMKCGDSNQCFGAGSCAAFDDAKRQVFCRCNEGYDSTTSCKTCLPDRELAQQCACYNNYKSVAFGGSYVCVKNTCLASNGKECNNAGTCVIETTGQAPTLSCRCNQNMSYKDNCVSCADGYYIHPTSSECVISNCLYNCNGNGACIETLSGKNCVCQDGFKQSDYCKTCLPNYHMKAGVCVETEDPTIAIVVSVVCAVIVLAAVGSGAWWFYNLKHRKHLNDELMMNQNLINDNGYFGAATKGLQLQI